MRLVVFVALCALSLSSSHLWGSGEGLSAEALEMRDDVLSFLDNSQARGRFVVPEAESGEFSSQGLLAGSGTALEEGKIIGLYDKGAESIYFLVRGPDASKPLVLFSAGKEKDACRYERLSVDQLGEFFAAHPSVKVANISPLLRDLTSNEESNIGTQLMFLCGFSLDPVVFLFLLGSVFSPTAWNGSMVRADRLRLRSFFLYFAPVWALFIRWQLRLRRLSYSQPAQVFLEMRNQIAGQNSVLTKRKTMLKYFYGSLVLSGALAWLGSYL